MEKHRIHKLILAIVIASSLLLAGCFIHDSKVSYTDKGAPVSDHTLRQIKCGETTKDWVVATLGAPSEQTATDNGVEILKYRYGKKQDSDTVILPFVIIDDQKQIEQTVYVEVKDNIVRRYWQENTRR
jgi:hypothetical protein